MWTKGFFTTVEASVQSCDASRALNFTACVDGDGKPRGKDALNLYVLEFDGAATLAWLCDPHKNRAVMLKGCIVREPTRQDIECLKPAKHEPVKATQFEMFADIPRVKRGSAGRVHA